VKVNLPEGVWFDYWTDAKQVGGRMLDAPVSLKTIPVFVKAGSFIPMADDMANTSRYDSSKLQLHYYADASVKSASGVMYDDDGKDPNALRDGRFEKLGFKAKHSGKRLDITLLRKGDFPGEPATRNIELVVHNWPGAAKSLRIDGKPQAGARYDAVNRTLHVPLAWRQDTLSVSVR